MEPSTALSYSPEQQRIIMHRGGHLQVVACAGSGKTETVARRVAQLLAEGVAPMSIVAFTFTNAAAASLKGRIIRKVQEVLPSLDLGRLAPMYVGTIHSYCLRFLQEQVPRYATYELFDEHRLVGLLVREAKKLGIEAIEGDTAAAKVRRFLDSASVVENEMLDLALLPAGDFKKVYERYLDVLDRYHVHTHNLCISRVVSALRDPAVFDRYHAGLRHLIVDEFQDINPAQAALIRRLAVPPVEVCVVGDDDQAIYQWRGSSVDFLRSFCDEFEATRETLGVNRRSRAGIVDLAGAFAADIPGRVPKAISATRSTIPHDVHRFVSPTREDEVAQIVTAIQAMIAGGVAARDIAILVRTRAAAATFVDALGAAGIDVRCEGRAGLFQQPEANLLARVFAWISGETEWKPAREKTPVTLDLDALIAEISRCFNVAEQRLSMLRRVLELLRKVVPGMKEADLVSTYHRLLNALGVQNWDPDEPETARRLGILGRFSRVVADYEHVTRRGHRRITRSGNKIVKAGATGGEEFVKGLAEYIAYYAHANYEDFAGEPDVELGGVTITTMHAAKGLEWPVVFVPFLTAGNLPMPMVGKPKDWLIPRELFPAARYEGSVADEERLFYVAMTRAREHLYLSRHDKAKWSVKPSPFFARVKGGAIPVSTKALWVPEHVETAPPSADERPSFTFSELAEFARCPAMLRFSRNLGFEPPVAKERGFGSAVHYVLRRLAERVRASGQKPSRADVDALFEREFYLPFADADVWEHLESRARAVVDAYLTDFADDLTRVWDVERPFELHLADMSLRGRADVVLDDQGGVKGALALVDYKTRPVHDGDATLDLQLKLYAAAARAEGFDVRAAWLHDLMAPKFEARHEVSTAEADVAAAVESLVLHAKGISARAFEARPGEACRYCGAKPLCGAAKG
ncbi:MAG: ATP-dependent DNA helicase [Polyangiales bacterium]